MPRAFLEREEQVQKSEQWLMLEVGVQSTVRNRPLQIKLEFKPEPELAARKWRS